MAKKGKEKKLKDPSGIPMAQPDRSGPSEATLLQLAKEKGLFDQADKDPRNKNKSKNLPKGAVRIPRPEADDDSDDDDEEEEEEAELLSPFVVRIMDTLLWTVSLTMLHGTLDVLVQNQYAISIEWPGIFTRTLVAFLVLSFLFYNLHEFPSSPNSIPGVPPRFQHTFRQVIFCATSVSAGSYLVYITNRFGYLYILKRAPTLGSLWVWSVLELDLAVAAASLAAVGAFLLQGGYAIK